MREYELMFIVAQTDIKQKYQEQLIEEVRALITEQEGRTLRVRPWGLRELAYEIKGQRRGYYVIMQLVLNSEKIHALEKFFNLHERVLKHMFVKLNDREVEDVEELQSQMSEKELEELALKKKGEEQVTSRDTQEKSNKINETDASESKKEEK